MSEKRKSAYYIILILILAGEAVFVLPFVLARIFRPTFLTAFGIDNFDLGLCFSIYGLVAMVSYGLGGTLADRFHPRILISIALISTAAGGFYMATYPSIQSLKILYGFWGFTTIFLFWAAMIKATRIWGKVNGQGKAFGLLDGGRGLVAASIGAIGVSLLSIYLPQDVENASNGQKALAFRYVILMASSFVLLMGIISYFSLKNLDTYNYEAYRKRLITLSGIMETLKIRSVWLLMVIVLTAYVGYKLTDDISLFANVVMGYNDVESGNIGTMMLLLRPVVGIGIGFLADKTNPSKLLMCGFILATLTGILFSSGLINEDSILIFFLGIILMALGVYAARVLYFAVMEKGKVPLPLTGTAVGIISLVGFTPDIFVGPVMGYFLDEFPGIVGHQYVFGMLSIFSILGLIASFWFYRYNEDSQI